MWSLFALSAGGVLGLAALARYEVSRRRTRLPPGPESVPLLGSALEILKELDSPWRICAQWSRQYGALIYFRVLQKAIIMIGSASLAQELLARRSSIYVCQPEAGDLNHRIRRYFSQPSLLLHFPAIKQHTTRLVNELHTDPNAFESHVRRFVCGVVLSIVFGHEVQDTHDVYLESLSRTETRSFIVERAFHILHLLPGFKTSPNQRALQLIKELLHDSTRTKPNVTSCPYNLVDHLASGNAKEEAILRDVLSVISLDISGGATAAVLGGLNALASAPVLQARAQAELNLVLGTGHPPDLSDRGRLPFIRCIVLEIIRWSSPMPLGSSYKAIDNDVFGEYLIPKHSTVIPNLWAMLHDPEIYPDPDKFDPDRFLAGEGRSVQPDPTKIAFGFGEGVSSGKELIELLIWTAVASVLYSFKVSPAVVQEKPNPSLDDMRYWERSVDKLSPTRCMIRPRAAPRATLTN